MQSVPHNRAQERRKPSLDEEKLRLLAINYVARYATSREKLRRYLNRKLKAADWSGNTPPETAALVERCAELGLVDDMAYATAKAASLGRQGYGAGRVRLALNAAGIAKDEINSIISNDMDEAMATALAFAKRRRFGPFARDSAAANDRQKQLAAMCRAGHAFSIACKILDLDVDSVQDI